MPAAWGAMCEYAMQSGIGHKPDSMAAAVTGELLGGEDRIDPTLFESCGDSLIVNLGSEEWTDVSDRLDCRPC